MTSNKANLRDLIAKTGQVILHKLDSNRWFFSPCDLETWWMTSKNYRATLLHYIKLCVSSQTPRCIQIGVTVLQRSIRVKIGDFLSRGTLKFYGWPWNTIGHLFHVASSFVHHFIAIGEFKLKLQSGNIQFGSKSAIYCLVWSWNLMNDLEKKRALILCCFKLYASFRSHQWIQTKVTVRKCSVRVKISDFLSRVTSKFDRWPWKTTGHLFFATSSFVRHFVVIVKENI